MLLVLRVLSALHSFLLCPIRDLLDFLDLAVSFLLCLLYLVTLVSKSIFCCLLGIVDLLLRNPFV